MYTQDFVKLIKEKIKKGIPEDFSGMGVVFVNNDLCDLPMSPLLSEHENLNRYTDEREIVKFLVNISNVNDIRHDGFHIVHITTGLKNISQYISPAIPCIDIDTVFNVGSRYRTAQYGSLYKSVISIIVVSQKGDITIAKNGKMDLIEL